MNTRKLIETVTRLLSANGRDIVVAQLSPTAVDATKPWQGQASQNIVNQVSTHGVFVPVSGTMDLGELIGQKELFSKSTEVCLVPPGATNLEEFNIILDQSIVWHIDFAKVLKPANETMLYVFGLSR